MLKKLTIVLSISAAMAAPTAHAITAGGELDGDAHPYVGLMIAKDKKGNPIWRCSGTLMGPRIFLTAGHCTEPPAASAELWFDADMQTDAAAKGYPTRGQASGKTYLHPQYDPNAFFLHDLGVVILDRDMAMPTYGKLPALDVLDKMASERGLQDVTFTAVGYGLQQINPVFVEQLKIRMFAEPHLLQINTGYVGDGSLLLSNNHSTGGTCFGDSGGPNFIGSSNVVGGVTSFGINGNCAGTGGVYRVDRADDLGWLYSAFGRYLR